MCLGFTYIHSAPILGLAWITITLNSGIFYLQDFPIHVPPDLDSGGPISTILVGAVHGPLPPMGLGKIDHCPIRQLTRNLGYLLIYVALGLLCRSLPIE